MMEGLSGISLGTWGQGEPEVGFNKEARRGWFATGLLSAWCARQPYAREEIRKSSKSSRGPRNEFQERYLTR